MNGHQGVPGSVDLRREALRAVALWAGLALLATAIFGPLWAKRGLWVGPVRSHAEYQQIEGAATGAPEQTGVGEEVILAADGSGTSVLVATFRVPGTGRTAVLINNGGYRAPDMQFVDYRNRVIPLRIKPYPQGEQWILTLPADLGPNRVIRERSGGGSRCQLAQRQGPEWVYSDHHRHGNGRPHTYTITLPPGATVTSATPKPTTTGQREGCPTLTWSGLLPADAFFGCRVTYRVP